MIRKLEAPYVYLAGLLLFPGLLFFAFWAIERKVPEYFDAVWFLFKYQDEISAIDNVLKSYPQYNAFRKIPSNGVIVCLTDWSQEECSQRSNEPYVLMNFEDGMFNEIWPDDRFEIFADLDALNLPESMELVIFRRYEDRFEIYLSGPGHCGKSLCTMTMSSPSPGPNSEKCADTNFPHDLVVCHAHLFGRWYMRYSTGL
jgi:hypothetical protein